MVKLFCSPLPKAIEHSPDADTYCPTAKHDVLVIRLLLPQIMESKLETPNTLSFPTFIEFDTSKSLDI